MRDNSPQDLPQPGDELSLAAAPEIGEMAMRLQEGFLHQVRRIDLSLEPAADLQSCEQGEIAAILFQQWTQGETVSLLGAGQKSFAFGHVRNLRSYFPLA